MSDEHEHEYAHDKDREARREERRAEREERRAERDARREERHRLRAELRSAFGPEFKAKIRDEVEHGLRGGLRGLAFGIGHAFGDELESSQAHEDVEQRFQVSGMPTVRTSNVSGETEVTVGEAGEVFVRARKRVRGWSEERAKRLLENVEVRMEQTGDEIVIEPRLFQQERGWHELFRGGRVAVDLDIRVPRETQLEARTVSGELSVNGLRGPIELVSVSAEVSVQDVQGPLRLRSVSGDANVSGYAGQLEVNCVSGDIEIERSRIRAIDAVTVSGDIEVDALYLAAGGPEARLRTVSGDVELTLGDADADIDFRTVSGDADVAGGARVEKIGRRDRRIVVGAGGPKVRVKSVSGDLSVQLGAERRDERTEEMAGVEDAIPMPPPAPAESASAAREILERLARGELSVDDAAAALDSSRR